MNSPRKELHFWRSLDELEQSPEFRQFVEREFPTAASEIPEGVSRRRWLQLMAASFVLAGVAGCRWETEKIAPFARRPPSRVPGEPEKYATAFEWAGRVRHLLVTCIDGRPIKIEGNPDHPESRGASDAVSQACILDLYDPDRTPTLKQIQGGRTFTRTWEDFADWGRRHFDGFAEQQGRGLALLFEPTTSPSVQALMGSIIERLPQARLYENDAASAVNERAGSLLAFDRRVTTRFDLTKAKIIFCLDADLLGGAADSLRHAREYAARRDPEGSWMNRLYSVESQMSVTGAAADHRLALRSGDIPTLLNVVEERLRHRLRDEHRDDIALTSLKQSLPGFPEQKLERVARFVEALTDDLAANRRESAIVVGPCQPPSIHARVHALNALLGNVDHTVHYGADPSYVENAKRLRDFAEDAARGAIDTVVILGTNPVASAPIAMKVADGLAEVRHKICLSLYEDETARLCDWRLPLAHPLESWGDVRSSDGTVSVTQPLIEPLLGGKSIVEVLAMLLGDRRDASEIVRETLGSQRPSALTDSEWRRTVHDGLLPNSAFSPITPKLIAKRFDEGPEQREGAIGDLQRSPNKVEIVFAHSHALHDGRLANNAWLQETPDPITKLTWDNAAVLSPATAERLGVEHGTLIDLRRRGECVRLPAFLLPGQAENSIGLTLGYGRRSAGRVGGSDDLEAAPVGVDVNPLRDSPSEFIIAGVQITPTGIPYELATTQNHHAVDPLAWDEVGQRVGDLVREGTLTEYQRHPDFASHQGHHPPNESLWQEPSYDDRAWGMAIDLNKCIGCNACVVACQAENNVPIVGKEQVLKGREMHWIRVDRYFSGDVEEPSVSHQPVACHHCENAPCEQVCPVAATVHSDEGLNDMIYNRCVGTRYCANNCPYKVRRFNFFDYNQNLESPGAELVQLGVNPEVTVRSRGVMEKCTYCVQRIQRAKIDAASDGRPVRDGETVTACQQACPAQAIEFGDLNDRDSRVARAHADPRAYGMLAELNVKPRTKYLARIRNPHPLLTDDEGQPRHDHQASLHSTHS
jgi:molybdopterin-containing oxidoreductase family iron-sulfur binding subunit